jgi:hypothetical protein
MGLACAPNDSRVLYVRRELLVREGNTQQQNCVLSFILVVKLLAASLAADEIPHAVVSPSAAKGGVTDIVSLLPLFWMVGCQPKSWPALSRAKTGSHRGLGPL